METEQILELDRRLRTVLGGKVAAVPDDMLAALEQLARTIEKVLLEACWPRWRLLEEGESFPPGCGPDAHYHRFPSGVFSGDEHPGGREYHTH